VSRFAKGKSGNPAGRPKGFAGIARDILKRTKDGKELVSFALKVMRDSSETTRDRLAAHAWLSDRALGKPLSSIDLNVGGDVGVSHKAIDMSKLSEAQLQALALLDGEGEEDPGDRG
jgi:hypothetical protein